MNSTTERVLLAVGLLGATLAALVATFVVPKFSEALKSFGAELPLLTSIVADYYLAAWLLPVGVLATWFLWPKRNKRGVAACLAGTIALFLVTPVLVFAMYLPIFRLAATV